MWWTESLMPGVGSTRMSGLRGRVPAAHFLGFAGSVASSHPELRCGQPDDAGEKPDEAADDNRGQDSR
jgi:hypothetical protein